MTVRELADKRHAAFLPAMARPAVPRATGPDTLSRPSPSLTRTLPLLALTLLVHGVVLLMVFPALHEDVVLRGTLTLFYHDGGRTLAGAVPYRDFLFEYPPGALVFIALPRLFAAGFLAYRTAFFVEMTLLDAAIVCTLFACARMASLPVARVLGIYSLGLLLLGPLVDYRIDLAPVALTALAILAWQRDRLTLAAVLLGLATGTKAYPLLLLPALLLDPWLRGRWREGWRALCGFSAALALTLSPLLFGGPAGIAATLRFQLDRHLQVESIWATVPLLLHRLTGFPLEVLGRERALVVIGPGDAAGRAGTFVLGAVALVIYVRIWRQGRVRARAAIDAPRPSPGVHDSSPSRTGTGPAGTTSSVVLASTTALLLADTVLSKVLSPQYLLWTLPSIALLPLHSRRAVAVVVVFLVALPLTQWIYPLHYGELVRLITPRAVAVLTLRNLLLAAALILLLAMPWESTAVSGSSRQPAHPAGEA